MAYWIRSSWQWSCLAAAAVVFLVACDQQGATPNKNQAAAAAKADVTATADAAAPTDVQTCTLSVDTMT